VSVGNGTGILLLAYGNPGRQDDGLGPACAKAIEDLGLSGVTVEADYQLNIEDAADLAEHAIVLFVDASVDAEAPFQCKRIASASAISFTSHSVSPESVLAICEDHFERKPEAWVLGIRGYEFEFVEELTPRAEKNLEESLTFVQSLINAWKGKIREGSGTLKKTILTIDDDSDIRATLRIVLEAEGFSVGEAANAEEGLKVVERIQPDAVIVDLMMESVDSGSMVAQKLKEENFAGPVYMLSSAGDTVRYNIDARELGLAGIFQKPIDPKTLVATLKSKLKED
jgi:hydrogenase maturation protease